MCSLVDRIPVTFLGTQEKLLACTDMSENDSLLPRAERGIRVEQLEGTRIQVEETGVTVTLRNEVHARTNHYIKKSRPFFPDTTLRTYIDCPYLLKLATFLWIMSLYGIILGALGLVPKELPLSFSVTCAVFFIVYCQHEWVNQKSLPVVKTQPVFHGQRHLNWFYEVTVTELKGMALKNYRAGIGFVKLTHGKIKFQAFNKTAVKEMSSAKCQSRWMLFIFFLMSACNLYVVLAYSNTTLAFWRTRQ